MQCLSAGGVRMWGAEDAGSAEESGSQRRGGWAHPEGAFPGAYHDDARDVAGGRSGAPAAGAAAVAAGAGGGVPGESVRASSADACGAWSGTASESVLARAWRRGRPPEQSPPERKAAGSGGLANVLCVAVLDGESNASTTDGGGSDSSGEGLRADRSDALGAHAAPLVAGASVVLQSFGRRRFLRCGGDSAVEPARPATGLSRLLRSKPPPALLAAPSPSPAGGRTAASPTLPDLGPTSAFPAQLANFYLSANARIADPRTHRTCMHVVPLSLALQRSAELAAHAAVSNGDLLRWALDGANALPPVELQEACLILSSEAQDLVRSHLCALTCAHAPDARGAVVEFRALPDLRRLLVQLAGLAAKPEPHPDSSGDSSDLERSPDGRRDRAARLKRQSLNRALFHREFRYRGVVWFIEPPELAGARELHACLQTRRYRIRSAVAPDSHLAVDARDSAVTLSPVALGGDWWVFTPSDQPMTPHWAAYHNRLLQSPVVPDVELSRRGARLLNRTVKLHVDGAGPELPPRVQESLLIADLLYCHIGISGEVVRFLYCRDELACMRDSGPGPHAARAARRRTSREASIIGSTSSDPTEWYFEVAESLGPFTSVDASFKRLTLKILSVCRIQRKIACFIERALLVGSGRTAQALGEVLVALLRGFYARVFALERAHAASALTLQELWCLMQPSLATFEILEAVVDAVRGPLTAAAGGPSGDGGACNCRWLRGSQILTALCDLAAQADGRDRKLLISLLEAAAAPLAQMLKQWLETGCVDDPHREWFLLADPAPHTHWTWETQFALRRPETEIPPFLRGSTAEHALAAGKHVAVLVRCPPRYDHLGPPTADAPDRRDLPVFREALTCSPLSPEFRRGITDCARQACGQVVRYLFVHADLKRRWESFFTFLFFAKADFLTNLFELIEGEVDFSNPATLVAARLDYLFARAVDRSSLANDPYRHEIVCTLSSVSARDVARSLASDRTCSSDGPGAEDVGAMIGRARGDAPPAQWLQSAAARANVVEKIQELLKHLTFVFKVRWPLTLIFTDRVILQYQLISRLILQLKFAERKLLQAWQLSSRQQRLRTRRCENVAARARKPGVQASGDGAGRSELSDLCLSMLHFVRSYTFYVTMEVLELQFQQFFQALDGLTSLDDILKLHSACLDRCLEQALLSEADVLRNSSRVLTVCHIFASTAAKISAYRLEAAAAGTGEGAGDFALAGSPLDGGGGRCDEVIHTYAEHFNRNLRAFLEALLAKSSSPTYAQSTHVQNLMTRLDTNGFYSRKLNLDLCGDGY